MGVNPQSFIIHVVIFFFFRETYLNDNICDCFRSFNFFKANFERRDSQIILN